MKKPKDIKYPFPACRRPVSAVNKISQWLQFSGIAGRHTLAPWRCLLSKLATEKRL